MKGIQEMAKNNSLDWMLWYEEIQKNGFEDALGHATAYYEQKYGHKPNRVQLPLAWTAEAAALRKSWIQQGGNNLEMISRKTVLPRHLLVTYDPQKGAAKQDEQTIEIKEASK